MPILNKQGLKKFLPYLIEKAPDIKIKGNRLYFEEFELQVLLKENIPPQVPITMGMKPTTPSPVLPKEMPKTPTTDDKKKEAEMDDKKYQDMLAKLQGEFVSKDQLAQMLAILQKK
jgi:hypothetical protein